MADDEITAVVMDIGSYSCKIGYARELAPHRIFSSYHTIKQDANNEKSKFVGMSSNEGLITKPIIERGIVYNWDHWELLMAEGFRVLGALPEEHPIFTFEAILNPKANAEKTQQILFETFNCPAHYSQYAGIATMFAEQDRKTALVVSSGADVTQIFPIYESYLFSNAVRRLNFGGNDITKLLQRRIMSHGLYYDRSSDFATINDIKESLCFVEKTGYIQQVHGAARTYTLPDGKTLTLDTERMEVPESIFYPSLAFSECSGLADQIYGSIMDSDIDARAALFNNIVICGGNTLFQGFAERLEYELKALAPSTISVKVIANRNRLISDWIGGSILSSKDYFIQMWKSKEEYDESGPSIIHRPAW